MFDFLNQRYRDLKRLKTVLPGTLPDALLIGAQKAGTSALYNYLIQHPSIHQPACKEVNYFDKNYERHHEWYKRHFPSSITRQTNRWLGYDSLTLDATPNYMVEPQVPQRAANLLDDPQIIVILRNPVERAHSQFRMNKRDQKEPLTFEEALAAEDERIQDDKKALLNGEIDDSEPLRRYSYKERGKYAEQLTRWFNHFSRERFHIIKASESKRNPEETVEETFQFLGVKTNVSLRDPVIPSRDYEPMQESTRKQLQAYFKPHNEELENLLGREFNWD